MQPQTLTDYLRSRVNYVRSEYPGEPIPREYLRSLRSEWASSIREYAVQGHSLDLRVAKSYLRVWGKEAIRDLRYLDNAAEIWRQPWASA